MRIRVLIAVAAVVALAGCGTDRPAAEPTDGTSAPSNTTRVPAAKIQFRRVITEDPARAEFAAFTCPEDGVTTVAASERDLACDDEGNKYLLAAAAYDGSAVSASAVIPEGLANWSVNVKLDSQGARAMTKLSTDSAGTGELVAFVVDGVVLSATAFDGVVTTGELQITGGLDEKSATALAERLS
jgi:preprotein translocase subunit SecD